MIRSMTGFGRAEAPLAGSPLAVEVRSQNGRHLEVRVRLPRDLVSLEAGVREAVGEQLLRGQVDVSLRLPGERPGAALVQIDLEVARRYVEAARTLANDAGAEGPLAVDVLVSLPGVTTLREPALEPEVFAEPILAAVRGACEACATMREREGALLDRELRRRIDAIESTLVEIEARSESVVCEVRERLERRIAGLAPGLELDPSRLEQEVVLHADRTDVTEEVVRIRSHLGQFRETLSSEGSVGRKLEFLLQELLREINTIGSKASDASIAHRVVETKTELERLREQVMNVE